MSPLQKEYMLLITEQSFQSLIDLLKIRLFRVCVYVCVLSVKVSVEAKRGCQIPPVWSYRHM